MFLTTQFQTIWMRGNKDKELKETLYFIFCLFYRYFSLIQLSVFIISDFLIEPHITYHIIYENQLIFNFYDGVCQPSLICL